MYNYSYSNKYGESEKHFRTYIFLFISTSDHLFSLRCDCIIQTMNTFVKLNFTPFPNNCAVSPYKFHFSILCILMIPRWCAQGKNYNVIKSYYKFQISITSNPIHNFTASIKQVICSGLRRLQEHFTSFKIKHTKFVLN